MRTIDPGRRRAWISLTKRYGRKSEMRISDGGLTMALIGDLGVRAWEDEGSTHRVANVARLEIERRPGGWTA